MSVVTFEIREAEARPSNETRVGRRTATFAQMADAMRQI
jgi:hypothetical protein